MVPRAHVGRLFLHPEDLLQVGIAANQRHDVVDRQRVQQLHARDGEVAHTVAPRVQHQVVIDATRAQQQRGHLVARAGDQRILDDGAEAAVTQVGERGRGLFQAQQALRREDHQRSRIAGDALVAQEVKVLRRRRAVGHAHVAVGGELEKPFDASAGMLWTAALVTMWQEQRQT